MIVIPTYSDTPNHSINVELDELSYAIRFQWNPSWKLWYAHLYDDQEVVHLSAQAVVLDFPLFRRWMPGQLFARLPGGLKRRQEDLSELELLYISREELDALA